MIAYQKGLAAASVFFTCVAFVLYVVSRWAREDASPEFLRYAKQCLAVSTVFDAALAATVLAQ